MNYPLKDIHIVVTRDRDQSVNLVNKLTALGGKVLPFPTIEISQPADWTSCDQALTRIAEYDWIIFSSVNGIRYFMDRAELHQIKYLRSSIACVGGKTAEILEKYRITTDLIPGSYNASSLLKEFERIDIKNKKILIPTSNRSRDELGSGLQKMGARVDQVVCYQTGIPAIPQSDPLLQSILHEKMDCFTFYSPSAFLSLIDMIGKKELERLVSENTVLAAIGPTTASTIRKNGFQVQIQPEKSLDESMIEAIVSYFNKKN